MTDVRDDQRPDSATDDDLEAERAGQSTTAEEAMDAATDEEGFADESAYTPEHDHGRQHGLTTGQGRDEAMTTTPEPGASRHRFTTQLDEMSLADEQAAQTPSSEPDTLEVRDDSRAIFQGVMNDLRRPLAMALVAAGVAALVAVGIAVITGAAGGDSSRSAA